MSRDARRAYTNNELNTSMTAINLVDNTVLARDIESSAPPAPGTQAHRNLVGKLAFFAALGVPDVLDTNGDGQFDIALRDIDPVANKGKASPGAWSGCASCHDDGHSDNVTWIFETGPRQTIPLEGTFARNNLEGSARSQLECGARFKHRLQQQRPRHPGRYRLRDQRQWRRQGRPGVQPWSDAAASAIRWMP